MNRNTAIKIENLSKQYRLGLVGTGTLSHDLKRWWTMNVLGKEDPYLKVGEVNVRESKGQSDYVWALKDINLEIEQGDVVGIIGKNGAGKSTLLKILSRVTKPTTGNIQYRGRIASLLEVGTGFHPEMTGRENIYMNGAIMGMTRHEITRKLDEIVAFAGVERYVDTPVKRYSSGMTVRLGFAVAAHLEPDILVVDEVLAVGDAEFQKKAIGKMQDVSQKGGRTVLFVSHNMAAVKNLCAKALLLSNGLIEKVGHVDDVVDYYIDSAEINYTKFYKNHIKTSSSTYIDTFEITSEIATGKSFEFDAEIFSEKELNVFFAVGIRLKDTTPLLHIFSGHVGESFNLRKGRNTIRCNLGKLPLGAGIYELNLWIGSGNNVIDFHKQALSIMVKEGAIRDLGPVSTKNGYPVITDAKWQLI